MDTGSSVLWVMGEDCHTQACTEHDQFGITDSTTYKTGAGEFSIQYATGSVSGDVITDHVGLAGLDLNMDFGVAKTTTDEFINYPIDGILGLARTPGPGPNIPTFLQVLQKNNLIKQNIFGMNLQRASDGTNDGEINFGTIDTTKFKGDLNWQNTVGDLSRWAVPVNGIMVNGKLTSLQGGRTAIIDTGTSYLYIPPTDAKPIFDAIPGETPIVNGSYVIPCNTNAQISLVFNGIAYNLPLKDYVGLPLGDGCVSHIFPQDVVGDGTTWLVGDTFLKNVYTVFDSDQSRVGKFSPFYSPKKSIANSVTGFGAKGETQTITSLVQSSTPTVSPGSNQILSSLPPSNTVISSSASGTPVAPGTSSSGNNGVLPIGPGQTSTTGSSPPLDASSSPGSASAAAASQQSSSPSSTLSTATTNMGVSSRIATYTIVQFTTAFLFVMGIVML